MHFPTGGGNRWGSGGGAGKRPRQHGRVPQRGRGIIFRPAADALLSPSHSSRLAESQICAVSPNLPTPHPPPSTQNSSLSPPVRAVRTVLVCPNRHPPTKYLHVFTKLIWIGVKNWTARPSSGQPVWSHGGKNSSHRTELEGPHSVNASLNSLIKSHICHSIIVFVDIIKCTPHPMMNTWPTLSDRQNFSIFQPPYLSFILIICACVGFKKNHFSYTSDCSDLVWNSFEVCCAWKKSPHELTAGANSTHG